MTISMYQASAPRFASTLRNLSAILDKAQAYCGAKKIEPTVLTGSRLFPDMFPLSREVKFSGVQYLLGFAQPNFYFHATTAYNILRHNGVEIGKRDFIGNP